ncbi:MAG: sugar ABC transporter permease [Firmicutes bacterium]|nr:sugar ABC transporter permease [Bacillota bacterium]
MEYFRKRNGKWRFSLTGKEAVAGLLFILPFLVGFFFIFLPLILESLQFSFSDMQVTGEGYSLTQTSDHGFGNYLRAFTIDPDFNLQLLGSISQMLLQVPLVLIFSFFAANLLNQKFHGRTAARSILFLPVIVSSGVILALENSDLLVATLDSTADSEAIGNLGAFLNITAFLAEYTSLPASVISVLATAVNGLYDIVIASGVQILIFLAGLQGISPSLYEASSMEGATQWENFWKITFPMISPLILVNSVYTIIALFTSESNEMMMEIRTTIFTEIDYGYGSAMAWIYFVCIAVIIAVVGGVISRHVFYYDER